MRSVVNLQQEGQNRHVLVPRYDFDLLDVRPRIGNRRGDLGEHARAVSGFALDLAMKLPADVLLPGNGDPLLGLLAKIREVAALVAMDHDTAPGRQVTHDGVAR